MSFSQMLEILQDKDNCSSCTGNIIKRNGAKFPPFQNCSESCSFILIFY